MEITPFLLAQRYIGIKELSEQGKDHPLIQWWLSLCGFALDTHDEIAWCSAFVNGIAWELRLPRSKSAMARSWLDVGTPVPMMQATVGRDVVVLKRGAPPSGHVGFYGGKDEEKIYVLGGNQGNAVSLATFPLLDVLGVRRLG